MSWIRLDCFTNANIPDHVWVIHLLWSSPVFWTTMYPTTTFYSIDHQRWTPLVWMSCQKWWTNATIKCTVWCCQNIKNGKELVWYQYWKETDNFNVKYNIFFEAEKRSDKRGLASWKFNIHVNGNITRWQDVLFSNCYKIFRVNNL